MLVVGLSLNTLFSDFPSTNLHAERTILLVSSAVSRLPHLSDFRESPVVVYNAGRVTPADTSCLFLLSSHSVIQ